MPALLALRTSRAPLGLARAFPSLPLAPTCPWPQPALGPSLPLEMAPQEARDSLTATLLFFSPQWAESRQPCLGDTARVGVDPTYWATQSPANLVQVS